MSIQPFEVHVPDAVLDDVRHRLLDARHADAIDDNGGLSRRLPG